MGFLEDIQGQIVALDTAPLIYFIEQHPVFHPVVRPLFQALAARQFTAVTSTLTLMETLVQPLRTNQNDLANRYHDILLHAENLTSYDLSPLIATEAARIRAEFHFRTPDAIQLATAVHAKAAYFVTNDHALKRFTDLQTITLKELVANSQ